MAAARASASSSKSAAKKSKTSAKGSSRATSASKSTKSAATKKATAKKAPAKKAAAKKAPAKKAAAKKAAAKKAPAKKAAAKKAPAKKAAAKKAPAKKAAAKKAPAKKSTAKTSTAEKAVTAKKGAASTPKRSASSSKGTSPDPGKGSVKLPKFLTDKKWLDSQREMLLEERKSYTHSAEVLAAEAASLMADREPGDVQFDEESGEGDTLAVERDRDLALSAKAREKVEEIDAALARLDAGTYGICVSGEDIIPKERLEALPMASKCVTHQTAMF